MTFKIAAVVLSVVGLALADDRALRVTASKVAVTRQDASDSEFTVLFVKFDASLLNRTTGAVRLAPSPTFLLQVDRMVDSSWKVLLNSTSYDTGNVKYEGCSAIRPGQAFTFTNLTADFVVRTDEKARDAPVVLKFYFQCACKNGSETIRQVFVTEPVKVDLPR